MKIAYNYHTHTFRCGHAVGEDEEYVLSAMKNKFKRLGFSDHVFFPYHRQPGIRGDYSLFKDYLESIRKLKEKYKQKIHIDVGLEAEYLPQYIDFYKDLLNNKTVDYLILGQHEFINDHNFITWYFLQMDNEQYLERYCVDLIKGMESGLFKYVCHPDLFANGLTSFSKKAEEISIRIIEASILYNVPLEINLGGYRHYLQDIENINILSPKKLHYPLDDFWKIASRYKKLKVIIGCDAHDPNDFNRKKDYEFAYSIVKKYRLNLIKKYFI